LVWPEKVPIYSGAFTPASGTETLSAVTVSLYDASGAIAGEVEDEPATGFTDGASASPVAFFDVDPIALDLDEPTPSTGQACYTLQFTATDSAGKRYVSTQALVLKPSGT
jgi:hypothetical protein